MTKKMASMMASMMLRTDYYGLQHSYKRYSLVWT